MPSTTRPQQKLFALAYTHPEKVRKKNRGVLKVPRSTMHDFMSLSKAAKK